MSFILEALKKADAERDRGAVPDLHAQAMLPEAAFEDDPTGRGRPWLWLIAGVGLALIAGVAWQWLGSDAPAAETIATPVAPVALPAAAVSVAPAQVPAATLPPAAGGDASRQVPDATHEATPAHPAAKAPAPARAGTPGKKSDTAESERSAKVPAIPRNEGAPPPSKPGAAVARKGAAKPAPVPKATAKASTPPAAVAAERVPLFAELPDDVRRQVPALKLGGLVYSAAPASRMVLVNGDVQREGSTVAPGLTLERINPKSAVFALRGQRFEVPL